MPRYFLMPQLSSSVPKGQRLLGELAQTARFQTIAGCRSLQLIIQTLFPIYLLMIWLLTIKSWLTSYY